MGQILKPSGCSCTPTGSLIYSSSDNQDKECTAKIKALANIRPTGIDDAENIIRVYYRNIPSDEEIPLMDLTADEATQFAAKEWELGEVVNA